MKLVLSLFYSYYIIANYEKIKVLVGGEICLTLTIAFTLFVVGITVICKYNKSFLKLFEGHWIGLQKTILSITKNPLTIF